MIIATPPTTNAPILNASLNAGLPALEEKPLYLNGQEAADLAGLQRTTRTFVLVGHTQLFHPSYAVLKSKAATFGSIQFIRSEGMALGPVRPDVSVLWNWTPHDVALCLDLMGILPDAVSAVDDRHSVAATLRFGDATTAWITNSNLSKEKRRMFSVHFPDRVLVFNDRSPTPLREYTVRFGTLPQSSPDPESGKVIDTLREPPLTCLAGHFEHL